MTKDARDPAERREGEGSHAISNGTVAERPKGGRITSVAYSSTLRKCSSCDRTTRWVFSRAGYHRMTWRACWEHMSLLETEAVKAVYREAGGYTWVS